MKKTYITPALDAVKIAPILMTVPSEVNLIDDEIKDEQYSNKYEGPAGGFLWEETTM